MSTTSGNTHVTKITIPTDQLRSLLPEEALLEIERRAIEKIAESVKDKIAAKGQPTIEGIVRDVVASMVKADMASETYALSAAWKFPAQGKAIITQLVQEAMANYTVTVAKDAAGRTAEALRAELRRQMEDYKAQLLEVANTAVRTRLAELDQRISIMARTEFLAVLKEAKEAGL